MLDDHGQISNRQFHLAVPPTPAAAYYNQRQSLAASAQRLHVLQEALNDPFFLSRFQWAQWFAYTLDYKPDLILELGRENGNSTTVFCQAVYENRHGRVVSLCLSDNWQKQTVPRLKSVVEPDWFDCLDARIGDMRLENPQALLGDAKRVLVLWDAHGFEIADFVLGGLLPFLANREHMILVHDISDLRYTGKTLEYQGTELWKGMKWQKYTKKYESRLYLGWIDTIVEQAFAIVDFLTRNKGELLSADDSFHREIGQDQQKADEMRRVVPADLWSTEAHWAYFSLNYLSGPYTFPKFILPSPATAMDLQIVANVHSLDLLKVLVRRLRYRLSGS